MRQSDSVKKIHLCEINLDHPQQFPNASDGQSRVEFQGSRMTTAFKRRPPRSRTALRNRGDEIVAISTQVLAMIITDTSSSKRLWDFGCK